MKRNPVLAPLAWILVGCAGLNHEAGDKAKSSTWAETLVPAQEPLANVGRNTYFVLEPGYQLFLAEGADGKKSQLTITVLNDTQKIGDVETRVVEERETANGKLVEVSRNFFAMGTQTKNIYYFGEDVDVYKGGQVVHEGAWRADAGGAKHGILVPGSIKIRDRYYQEKAPQVAMDRAENVSTNVTVKTPAGSFADCLKTKETTPLEPASVEYKYYAPGIGLVQDGDLTLVKYGRVQN